MKRLTIYLIISLLTFSLGILSSSINPLRWKRSQLEEPLQIRVLSRTELVINQSERISALNILVENVSEKTVVGYALRYEGHGFHGVLHPRPKEQVLRPGESKIETLPRASEHVRVWADYVSFDDKTTWGPNETRSEGYVSIISYVK